MTFQISLAFHIVGAVLWIGGLMVVSGMIRYFETTPEAKSGPAYHVLIKRYYNALVLPGLIVSGVSGLSQIVIFGVPFYMTQGWFHAKLTWLIALFILTFMVWRGVKLAHAGAAINGRRFGMLHGMIGAVFLLIIFTTYIGRL